jgi:hypothetical protein
VSGYPEKPERALNFLRERGHLIGPPTGNYLLVDRRPIAFGALPELAHRLYGDEWLASEDAFLRNLADYRPSHGKPRSAKT